MATSAAPSSSSSPDALQTHLDLGNKAFALRQYEDAAESFTVALELYAAKYGDASPESAPLLLIYGKTLLELAIAQNQVMQQEGAAGGAAGGDDEDEGDEEQDGKDKAELAKNIISELTGISEDRSSSSSAATTSSTVKVSSPVAATPAIEEQEQQGEDGDEMEAPEDDFNAAWEVLDAARTLFGKMEGGKARLQEADCLITLGDISLETENFGQAVEDFRSALSIKSSLLPSSSRQISECQLKLGMALEFDPEPESRPLALEHLIKAKETLLLRKEELASGTSGFALSGGKGKGKGGEVEGELVNDRVEDLSPEERKAEGKDIEELIQDLDSKIEDLRTAPLPSTTLPDLLPSKPSTPFAPISSSSAPVNDLSSMVKKKKSVAPAAPAPVEVKRKVSEEEEVDAMVKKAKTA